MVGVHKFTLLKIPGSGPGRHRVSFTETEAGPKETVEKLLQGEPVSVKLMDKFKAMAS